MDITSLIGTLLSSDSVSGVSKSTKASSSDVQSVLTAALPLLLNGAKQQAEDESTAESFASALLSHGKKDTSNLSSFLSAVDMDDGAKIIGHLLGNDDSAVKEIAKESGVSAKTTSNVLSAAAPLLMSLLGQSSDEEEKKKKSGAGGGIALALAAGMLLKNVDFGGLLGGLLDVSADEEIAEAGLNAMEEWMKKLGLAMKLSEIGGTEDMIEGIADGTIILEGGYKVLTRDDVVNILKESL